jgi:glucokinase
MAAIGIDVGGSSIKAGIVDKKGKIIKKIVLPAEAEKGRKAVVNNIIKALKILLKENKRIFSICFGVPGIIDKNGHVSYSPNLPLSNFSLGRELKSSIKKKLFFANDADCFALAQLNFGNAKGKNTAICLTLGTGIGSGIIINKKLFTSRGAPELGHTTIKFDSSSKCCGNNGCLESFIGRKSFSEEPLEVYKKALKGNKSAIKKFEEYGKYLGIALSNFINIFNPEIIILGGEVSNAFSLFKKSMQAEIKKRALFKNTKIVKNNIRDAGIIGAASLCSEN